MPGRVKTPRAADWTEKGTSGSGAAQTLSHAAVAGLKHYICGVTAGATAAGIFQVSINDHTTEIFTTVAHNSVSVTFPNPIECRAGKKADLVVALVSGQTTEATIWGYSL